jgi:hypothetical protein
VPKISECRNKCPNISWHTKPRRCESMKKMKTQFTNKNTHILRTDILQKQCGRELLFIGARKRGPEARGNFLNFESLKCHFLDFGEVLTEC